MSERCAWCGKVVLPSGHRRRGATPFCCVAHARSWWRAAREIGGAIARVLEPGALAPIWRENSLAQAVALILDRCNASGAAQREGSGIEPRGT